MTTTPPGTRPTIDSLLPDPVWVHGLRAPRRRLALHPETARLTKSRLHLGDLSSRWFLSSSDQACFIGSYRTDVVLTTISVPGAIRLGVDRSAGVALRLDGATPFREILQQGTFWADPARIGDAPVLIIKDALCAIVAPAYLVGGLFWTPYPDIGRTMCLNEATWAGLVKKPTADEIEQRTTLRPMRRTRWERPPRAARKPEPTWKSRLEGGKRRHARSPGPGAIAILAGQIAIPNDLLDILGSPKAISIGLQRVGSGDVVFVLAAATPERAGYVVRRPHRTGSQPSLRLDARAAWLRAILGKGCFPAVAIDADQGTTFVVVGAIRCPRDLQGCQGLPAGIADLFTNSFASPVDVADAPGEPSAPVMTPHYQQGDPVGSAS